MKYLFTILTLFSLNGCIATMQPQVDFDDSIYYKRDMVITHNGKKCDTGVCVFPALEKGKMHEFEIEPLSGRMDTLHIASCHMHRQLHKRGKYFVFRLKPDADVELSESCPIYIQSFDTKQQAHSFAYIDFEHENLELPVATRCDGDVDSNKGVGACQGLYGSLQEVEFPVEVDLISVIPDGKWTKKDHCELEGARWVRPGVLNFKVNHVGVCQYQYIEKTEPFRASRVSVIGYQRKILPRDEQGE